MVESMEVIGQHDIMHLTTEEQALFFLCNDDIDI